MPAQQGSHEDGTHYYDARERRRSPPRYERAVLDRLHRVRALLEPLLI